MSDKIVFALENIDVEYRLGKTKFLALSDLTLQGYSGETVGVVGESGSGKSTLAKTLMCLQTPSKGKVFFEEHDLLQLSQKQRRRALSKMQMIFQDPDASLNPRMSVQDHLKEAIECSHVAFVGTIDSYIKALLDMVQLPASLALRYSYQLSGGQKQRVSLARALSVKPKLIICDEPLSSLDISVVAQILLLLKKLQEEQKLSYLFITHDLASLRYLAHRVVVLYMGRTMEIAPATALYTKPLHPYTQALMAAIPEPIPTKSTKLRVVGDPPSSLNPPSGCPFHTRCPFAQEICRQITPLLRQIHPHHKVACHFA